MARDPRTIDDSLARIAPAVVGKIHRVLRENFGISEYEATTGLDQLLYYLYSVGFATGLRCRHDEAEMLAVIEVLDGLLGEEIDVLRRAAAEKGNHN